MTLPVWPSEPELDLAPAPPFLVEVAFKGQRRAFYRCDFDTPPPMGAAVIVDVDRGEDLGRVHATGERAVQRAQGVPHGVGSTIPETRIIRLATPAEVTRERALRLEDETARRTAAEKVRAAKLDLKLSDAEWQFDRRKLTFYFTAEKRIDFRTLVRDLASLFRARIELKQYGVRDEAKRLSGIGRCGREYCSASWLTELRPVNLGVAKEQRLSLNPSQISGACGRLMCCLRYEHDFYAAARKRFPKEGKILVTANGEEKVVSVDIFRDRVTLRTAEGEVRIAELAELTGAPAAAVRPDAALESNDDAARSDTVIADPAAPEPAALEPAAPEPRARTDRGAPTRDAPRASTREASRGASRSTRSPLPPPPPPAPPVIAADAANNAANTAANDDGHDDESPDTSDAPASDAPDDATAPRRRRRGRRGGRRGRGPGAGPSPS